MNFKLLKTINDLGNSACNRNNYSVSLKFLSFNLNLVEDRVQNNFRDDCLLLLPPVTTGIIAAIQFLHNQLLLPEHEYNTPSQSSHNEAL